MASLESGAISRPLMRIFRRPALSPAKTAVLLSSANEALTAAALPLLGGLETEFCYYVDAAEPLEESGR